MVFHQGPSDIVQHMKWIRKYEKLVAITIKAAERPSFIAVLEESGDISFIVHPPNLGPIVLACIVDVTRSESLEVRSKLVRRFRLCESVEKYLTRPDVDGRGW